MRFGFYLDGSSDLKEEKKRKSVVDGFEYNSREKVMLRAPNVERLTGARACAG